ncbi:MAG: hypothetical protein LBT53_04630 [Puniceicoccales bacterium]|nr:hypothetical protein [Puniceicoccales bacterium]
MNEHAIAGHASASHGRRARHRSNFAANVKRHFIGGESDGGGGGGWGWLRYANAEVGREWRGRSGAARGRARRAWG